MYVYRTISAYVTNDAAVKYFNGNLIIYRPIKSILNINSASSTESSSLNV